MKTPIGESLGRTCAVPDLHSHRARQRRMEEGKLRTARVTAGQRCPRCGSSLDVAVVVQMPQAA